MWSYILAAVGFSLVELRALLIIVPIMVIIIIVWCIFKGN